MVPLRCPPGCAAAGGGDGKITRDVVLGTAGQGALFDDFTETVLAQSRLAKSGSTPPSLTWRPSGASRPACDAPAGYPAAAR